uniref:Uncharacterized protein n=1 Tax=viral metagenome TaxID=1070528 RepID=A0A6C0CYV3_9ZZZZ
MANTAAQEQAIRAAEARGWQTGWELGNRKLAQANRKIEQQKDTIENLLGEKCQLLADLEQFKKDRGLDALNQKMKQEVEVLHQAHKQEVEAMRKKMDKQKEETESLRALAVSRFTDLQRSERRVRDKDHELETFKEQAESRTAELLRMRRLVASLERDLMERHEEIQRLREAQCLSSWGEKDLKNMMSGLFLLSEDQKGTDGNTADMQEVDYMRLTDKLMKIYISNGFNRED